MDAYGLTIVGSLNRKVTAITQASSPYTLSAFQSGQIFTTAGATAAVQFNLPTIVNDDDDYKGVWFTFVKLTAYNLVIDAQAGEYIANSSASGQVQNTTAAQTYATITLVSVSNTQWMIEGAHGTWTTV
jgi:hypothetical protein